MTKFFCPVVGEGKSHIDPFMCKLSYLSYQGKTLQIGIIGIEPYFVPIKTGLDGTDIRLLKMLSERLYFEPRFVIPSTFIAVEELVGTLMKTRLTVGQIKSARSMVGWFKLAALGQMR